MNSKVDFPAVSMPSIQIVSSADSKPESRTGTTSSGASSKTSSKSTSSSTSSKTSSKTTSSDTSTEVQSDTASGTSSGTGHTSVPASAPSNPSYFAKNWYFIVIILALICIVSALVVKLRQTKDGKGQISSTEWVPEIPVDTPHTEMPDSKVTVVSGEQGLRVAKVHNVGNRANQQDSFGLSDMENTALTREKGVLVVVADGMGGLQGGDQVSSRIVTKMLTEFTLDDTRRPEPDQLRYLLDMAVNDANQYLTETVGLKKGGSTLISGIVKDGLFNWISVGDSRIAIYRNGKLTDLNKKHNWGAELDMKVLRGEISRAEAMADVHRNELTSYIGMGKLKYVDYSQSPIALQTGDRILFMSDGIYNALTDTELENILSNPIEAVSDILTNAVLQKRMVNQDNFTAVILEYE